MVMALMAWKIRTGGDVSEFLGRWEPHERQIVRALFLLWSRPTSLTNGDARCVGEFRTTFRTIPRLRSSVDRATVS